MKANKAVSITLQLWPL